MGQKTRRVLLAAIPILALVALGSFQNCAPVQFESYVEKSESLASSSGDPRDPNNSNPPTNPPILDPPVLPPPPVCRELDALEVKPKLKWDWYASMDKSLSSNYPKFSQVMSTPMVADLDGDGFPEVVFTTFTTDSSEHFSDSISSSAYSKNGVVRIVDGRNGMTRASIGQKEYAPFGTTSPLLADLDGDGKIEIIYAHYTGKKIIALNFDGSFRWSFETTTHAPSATSLSAADFNGDGKSEVLLNKQVLTEDQNQVPQVMFEFNAPAANNFAYSLDANRPNQMQIVSRSGVFNSSGKILYPLDNNQQFAVADMDANTPGLEIVGSGGGFLKIFDSNNGNVLKSFDMTAVNELKCSSGIGGGPPTIGDFDGDPNTLEVAVATGKYLSIFAQDARLIAKYETQDCSSKVTGMSSFDFNGDGKPEILYGDEEYFRIFEIKDNALRVVYKIVNPSGTLWEYPVVVDVDGNGSSEIVIASNNYAAAGFYKDAGEVADAVEASKVTGVRAFEASVSGSWMPTRKIWHQYEYNPALVTERGVAASRTPVVGNYTTKMFRRNTQLAVLEPMCTAKK